MPRVNAGKTQHDQEREAQTPPGQFVSGQHEADCSRFLEEVKEFVQRRREAGLARRNETVRLTYPDGFWIEYEFAAKEGVPAKIIYKRSRKNPDSGDVEETNEEDRLAKPITIDGVTAPWVIDHFTNGTQTTRINYESVQYNQALPDSLFAKPANIKAIK